MKSEQALYPQECYLPGLASSNVIESVFATVRLRHDKTKGSGSRSACLTIVDKLMESTSRHWRALNGTALLPEVVRGIKFTDGVGEETEEKSAA
jgi:hypothetical protein